MFNSKKDQHTSNSGNDNFSANTIQTGTSIEGHIKSDGSIRIDGILNGSISTKAKLVIGKTGIITGDVHCENASIEGRVEGKLQVQNLLDLKSTALINGDIFTAKLVVSPGAVFNGTCKMDKNLKSANLSGKKGNFEHKKAV
ncbi:MAG: bactofilin family protein [Chitinophagales bacterium]